MLIVFYFLMRMFIVAVVMLAVPRKAVFHLLRRIHTDTE